MRESVIAKGSEIALKAGSLRPAPGDLSLLPSAQGLADLVFLFHNEDREACEARLCGDWETTVECVSYSRAPGVSVSRCARHQHHSGITPPWRRRNAARKPPSKPRRSEAKKAVCHTSQLRQDSSMRRGRARKEQRSASTHISKGSARRCGCFSLSFPLRGMSTWSNEHQRRLFVGIPG